MLPWPDMGVEGEFVYYGRQYVFYKRLLVS